MAKKPTVTTLQSGFNSTETLNANFEALRDGFDNTLSLDGSTPNAMEADLDLNGNNIIGAAGLLINGTDYLSDVKAAKAAALVAQAAAELAETNAETAENNAESSETAAASSATASQTSATASQASRLAAETAETNAETAETNAATSKTAAATSEANAATSATTASTGATTATTKATEAATSATNATTSATNAATSETNAATSATTATTKATAAATSATNAATSATTATTKASEASTSATGAATSATNAATSATTATTKATAAATSETNAATYASTATTKASQAATSATNAATSATESETAKTAAEAAKDAALAALDSFDDRYLGAKASNPTLDNDGNALVAGALYYNTTDDVMKVYEGSVWVAAYASLSGALLVTNNLSDVTSVSSSRTNLGLGAANSPTFAGLTTTADVSFGDNDKALFGAGSDLQIYHNGLNSYIEDTGTGSLIVRASTATIFQGKTTGETQLSMVENGAVTSYYDNSAKLATTSTGVDVTGTITSDGLTVDGGGSRQYINSGHLRLSDGYNLEWGGGTNAIQGSNASNHILLKTNNTEAMRIDNSGNVGIGTTSALYDVLTVDDTNPKISMRDSGVERAFFEVDSADNFVINNKSISATILKTSDAERMRITSDGKVGFGTTNPKVPFHTVGPSARPTALAEFDTASTAQFQSDSSTASSLYVAEGSSHDQILQVTDGTTNSNTAGNLLLNPYGGNVGIATISPSTRLTVGAGVSSEEIRVDAGAGWADLTLNSNSTNGGHIYFNDGSNAGEIFYYHVADYMAFNTAGTEAMRIDSSGNLGINKTNPATALDVNGTVTATSYAGDGSALTGIAAGAGGGGSDEIFWENGQNVTTNYTITNGKNAMSAGPITINSGITVTVGSGETWTVV